MAAARLPVVVLVFSLLPALAQAEFLQQGPKLVGAGAIGASAQGTSVGISGDGDTAIVGGPDDNGGVGAAWVYTRSRRGVWHQEAELIGTGAVGAAGQGTSVALSVHGNIAIVGGPNDNGFVGAAWVYTRSHGLWTQQAELVGAGAVGVAEQGASVALSRAGSSAIVGGPDDNGTVGAAWVYTRAHGIWTQYGAKLVGTGIAPGAILSKQGSSVALSADSRTAIVGGPFDDFSLHIFGGGIGASWVYARSRGAWSQQGPKLVGSDYEGFAYQGESVSLSDDGNTAIVGGPGDNFQFLSGSRIGAAWIYARLRGVWSQQGPKLVGDDAVGGAYQGQSVALSGDGMTAIIGGPGDNSPDPGPNDYGAGAAWVFTLSGGTWTQEGAKLVGTGNAGVAMQGASVSLSEDGKTAIVGGPADNSPNPGPDDFGVGAAWIFTEQAAIAGTPGRVR